MRIQETRQGTDNFLRAKVGKGRETKSQKESGFSKYRAGHRTGLTSAHFSLPWNLKIVTIYCSWLQKEVGQQAGVCPVYLKFGYVSFMAKISLESINEIYISLLFLSSKSFFYAKQTAGSSYVLCFSVKCLSSPNSIGLMSKHSLS